jgi:hypothetical protein
MLAVNPIVKKLPWHRINREKISFDCKSIRNSSFDFQMMIFISSNYHEDNEGLINRQINLELYASYAYMAMAHHFDRYDVALKGETIDY